MTKQNQQLLMWGAAVLVVGYLIHSSKKKTLSANTETSSFSNARGIARPQRAGGKMECRCAKDGGGYVLRQCRKTQHTDCVSCCAHYDNTSHNEGLNL
jgi:hypothetical protein